MTTNDVAIPQKLNKQVTRSHEVTAAADSETILRQTLITKPELYEMEIVLEEEDKVNKYITGLDDNAKGIIVKREMLLKNKYFKLLTKLDETKKKVKYLEAGLRDINEVLDEDPKIQRIKADLRDVEKWFNLVFKFYSEFTRKTGPLEDKMTIESKLIAERKAQLNQKNHSNILLAATKMKLKKILSYHKIRGDSKNSSLMDLKRVSIDSTNSLHNKIQLTITNPRMNQLNNSLKSLTIPPATLSIAANISSQQFIAPNKKSAVSQQMKAIIHNKHSTPEKYIYNKSILETTAGINRSLLTNYTPTGMNRSIFNNRNNSMLENISKLDINKFELSQPIIDVPLSHKTSIDMNFKIITLNKELKSLLNMNQILKAKIIQNTSYFNQLPNLFNDSYSYYYKCLISSQKASNRGMNGTLLFHMLDNKNRGDLNKHVTPVSQITIDNFFNSKKNVNYFSSAEAESIHNKYTTFQKMVYLDSKKYVKPNNPTEFLSREIFMSFDPIQVMGVIFLKPDIIEDINYEFEEKIKLIQGITDKLRVLRSYKLEYRKNI